MNEEWRRIRKYNEDERQWHAEKPSPVPKRRSTLSEAELEAMSAWSRVVEGDDGRKRYLGGDGFVADLSLTPEEEKLVFAPERRV